MLRPELHLVLSGVPPGRIRTQATGEATNTFMAKVPRAPPAVLGLLAGISPPPPLSGSGAEGLGTTDER